MHHWLQRIHHRPPRIRETRASPRFRIVKRQGFLGRQGAGDKPGQNDAVVAWTHEYGPKKTRVFSTTVGHNNDTVSDVRYLDLVARGLLWSCGRLADDGRPVSGFGAAGR